MKTSPSICSASLALLLAIPTLVKAAPLTWTGGGSDLNWGTTANWQGGAPVASGTADLVFLSGSNTTSTNNLAGLTASSITFNGSSDNHLAGTNLLTIAGNVVDNTGSWQYIEMPTALLGTISFQVNSGLLTMSNSIANSTSAGGINKSGPAWLYLSGANSYTGGSTVSEGLLEFQKTASLPSSGSISANNTGALGIRVGGSGEFTNATSGAGSLGGFLSAASFSAGTWLGLDVNSGSVTYSGTIGGVQGLMKLGGGTLVLTGSNMAFTGGVNLNGGSLQIDVESGATTYNGIISGGGSLIKNTVGTLTLSGNSTFTGGLNISTSGTLQASGTSAFGAAGSTITFSAGSGAVVDLATDTSVRAYNVTEGSNRYNTILVDRATAGPGILHSLNALSLGSSTLTFTKGANVTNGTASVSFASMDLSAGNNDRNVILNGDAAISIGTVGIISSNSISKTLQLDGVSSGNTVTGVISNGTGTGILSLVKANTSTWTLTGANTFTGPTTITGGTLQIGNGGSSGSIATSSSITNNGALVFNFGSGSPSYGNTVSGTGALTKLGGAPLTLSGSNTYGGGTTFGGWLIAGSSNALGSGTVTLLGTAAGTQGYSLELNSGVTIGNPVVVNAGAGTTGGHASVETLSGTGTFTGSLAYNGNTTAGGVFGAKNGSTLVISNVNVLSTPGNSGTLTIRAGNVMFTSLTGNYITVAPGNGSPDGSTGILGANNAILNTATLDIGSSGGFWDLNGYNQTVAGITNSGGATGTSATIRNNRNGTTSTLSVNNSADYSFNATLLDGTGTGILALVKSGTGALTLSGSSGYSGGTTLNAGTLKAGSNYALGSGTVTLAGGALSSGATVTLANALYVASNTTSQVYASSSGNLSLTGAVRGSGTLTTDTTLSNSVYYTGDLSGFTGTFVYNDQNNANNLNLGSTTAGSLNASSAKVILSGVTSGWNRALNVGNTATSGTFQIGDLSGTGGVIEGSGQTTTIQVGALGLSGTFAGTINNNGTTSLTKVGAGTLTLTGSSTYTGVTTINAGALQIGNGGTAGALGTSTSIVDNASLIYNRSDSVTVSAPISGTGSLSQAGSGALTLTGANTYSGGTTITGGTLQIGNGGTTGSTGTNAIVDHAWLAYNFSSSGTAILPAAGITGSGNLISSAGLIQLNGNVTLSGTQSYTQVGSGSQYTGVELVSGATTLSGAGISMSADIGKRNSDGNAMVLDTSAVNGPINLNISLGRSGVWFIPSGFTATAGTGAITVAGSGPGSSGWRTTPVTLSGAVNVTANVNSGASVTINANAASSVSGTFSGGMSLTKGGNATLTVGVPQSYTGATSINGGVLSTAYLANGGSASGIGAAGSSSGSLLFYGGTLQYTGTGASTNHTFNMGTNATIDSSGSGPVNFTSTAWVDTIGSGTHALTLTGTNTGDNRFSPQLHDYSPNSSVTSLTKNGSGTWYITSGNANGFSGPLTINSGILRIQQNGTQYAYGTTTINNGATLALDSGATDNIRAVVLNGGSLTAGTPEPTWGTYAFNSGITVTGSGLTSTISASGMNGSSTIPITVDSGAILNVTGDFGWNAYNPAITKSGTGVMNLTGTNSTTGALTINAGTVRIGDGNTSGSIASTSIVDNGSLIYNRSDSVTVSAPITGSGSLTHAGSGTLLLKGSNTYGGGTTVNSGVLQIGDGSSAGGIGTGAVVNNGSVVFSPGANTVTVPGAVSGTGALTVNGPGTVVLSGSNSFGGGVTLNGGKVQIGASGLGAEAGALTVAGSGTVQFVSGFGASNSSRLWNLNADVTVDSNGAANSLTLTGTVAGSGALNKTGAGTLALDGANAFTGSINVQAGTLAFDSATVGANIVHVGLGGKLSITGTSVIAGDVTLAGNGGSLSSNAVIDLTGGPTGINTLRLISGGTPLYVGAGDSGAYSLLNVNVGVGNAASMLDIPNGTFMVGVGGLSVNPNALPGATSGSATIISASYIFNDAAITTPVIYGQTAGSFGLATSSTDVVLTWSLGSNPDAAYWNGGLGGGMGSVWFVAAGNTNWVTDQAASANSLVPGANTDLFLSSTNAANLTGQSLGANGSVKSLTFNNGTSVSIVDAVSTLNFAGSGTVLNINNAGQTLTLAAATSGSGAVVIDSGTLQVGNGGTVGSLPTGAISGSAGTLAYNLSANIAVPNTIGGGLQVVQSGSGVLTLSASNSYTGGTTINAGTLRLGNSGALGASGSLTINNAGVLDLNGVSPTIASLTAGSNAVITSGGGSPSTLTFANSAPVTFSGSILDGAGVVGLAASGPGEVTLTASNSYSGGTVIYPGANVAFSKTANLGVNTGNIVLAGGTLSVLPGNDTFYHSIDTGTTGGAINITSGATFQFNGYTSGVNGVIGTGPIAVTLAASSVLKLSSKYDATYPGNWSFTGPGAIEVQDQGSQSIGRGQPLRGLDEHHQQSDCFEQRGDQFLQWQWLDLYWSDYDQ